MTKQLDVTAVLLFLAICFTVLSLFRPHAELQRDLYQYLFVIDITQSMNVTDSGLNQQQSRLELARQAIRQSIDALPCGSEAGLAIFTEYRAFMLFAPIDVCANYAELHAMIQKVDWTMAWAYRSEVSKGLYSGIEITAQLNADVRLVFISDGHEAPPLNAELRPEFDGEPGRVSGLIAGVGGSMPVRIPRLDREGNPLGYWRHDQVMQVDGYTLGRAGSSIENEVMTGVDRSDLQRRIEQGKEHLSSLNKQHLLALSRKTGLDYMTIVSPGDLAVALTNQRYAIQRRVATDVSALPGAVGLLFLVTSYLYACLASRLRYGQAWEILPYKVTR